MIMNPQEFTSSFAHIVSQLIALSDAVAADCSLLGSMSIEDYQLFQGMVKELAWNRGL